MSHSQELMTMTGTKIRLYELTTLIGAGAFGAIHKGVTGQDSIAIKISLNEKASKIEADLLRTLHNSGVVPKFYFDTQNGIYHIIGMELMRLDLETLRDKMPYKTFKKPTLGKLAFQAVHCFKVLHSYNIIHRDMKLGNMAITLPSSSNRQVKLRLFDLAPDVQMGLLPSPKDDLVQLSYGIIHASGFDITQKLSLPSDQLLAWKHGLLHNPSDALPGLLKWMTPWYKEIGLLSDILPINYGALRMKIQDSMEEYDVRADLILELEDGEPMLV
ncbi:hypothetical protein B9Z55_025688 [Caenorhabditis nigoni]|uniref:Protein kinase domain-containing protein n=1 Tax=Caenorhabditis nigoni TaxID=1611254 RepID=A0A2G5S9X5_9PELO|nr:hypothetical protein B9Z55_028817 [Caenorhabditis nigoni]PIC20514.1 hypothetical protein B9Z55_025688 [Caenorhabditis nigoni]